MLGDDGRFHYTDFLHFLRTYDLAASVIRTAEDYRDITYEYLCSCAAGGAIYVELTASPDHAALVGLSDEEHLGGIAARDRRRPSRHRDRGADPGLGRAQLRRRAGAPRRPPRGRAPAPLRRRLLDGRRRGRVPGRRLRGGVRDRGRCRPRLHDPRRRVGGRREHPRRAASCRSPGSTTACARSRTRRSSPSSPRAGSCSSAARPATSCSASIRRYEEHPLPTLRAAGVRVTLGSDDPPYFGATIEGEYDVCAERMGFGEDVLREITATAIDAAFCDEEPASGVTHPSLIVRSSVCSIDHTCCAPAGAMCHPWKPKKMSTSHVSSPPR